jgi:3-dehydroquinate synthase
MNTATRIDQRIGVEFNFPVVFTDNIFAPENPALPDIVTRLREERPHRLLVMFDSGVVEAFPGICEAALSFIDAHPEKFVLARTPVVVTGGEQVKSGMERVEALCETMLEARLSRHCFVIGAGGAAFLDVVGMAAALVHRGVRLIRIPTTALAQADAGVGVKNGVNFAGVKNGLGTFAPPFGVVNDFSFLRSLPAARWREGIAEAFKVALIKDARFFHWLCDNAAKLAAGDETAQRHLVRRCAELHLEHIASSGDPFEMGRARPLDFGHWSAHKLETMSQFRISHGDAVAAGVLLDSIYAQMQGWLANEDLERLAAGMKAAHLPTNFPEMHERDAAGKLALFGGLEDFREHLGGELSVTFPNDVGQVRQENSIDLGTMTAALKKLEAR